VTSEGVVAFGLWHRVDRAMVAVLLIVHAGLLLWAAAGFVELLASQVPWPRLSHPLFPPAILVLHWTAIAAGATTFLAGYVSRWRKLPEGMVIAYGFMAAVCALETFTVLDHDGRFAEMALEYATYGAILVYLFRSPAIRQRIGTRGSTAAIAGDPSSRSLHR